VVGEQLGDLLAPLSRHSGCGSDAMATVLLSPTLA
jgi:hypothetical protein